MTSKLVRKNNIVAASFVLYCRAASAATLRIWRLVVAIEHRRELAHLAYLDDRMLADIGLTRCDLHDAQSEPLSRDPTCMLARRAAERRAQLARSTWPPSQRGDRNQSD